MPSKGTTTKGTTPKGTTTKGTTTKGNTTKGNTTKGNTTKGTTPKGNTTKGTTTKGTTTKGTTTKGTTTKGNTTKGTTTKGTTTKRTTTKGTTTKETTTKGTTTKGTTTKGTTTKGTDTKGTDTNENLEGSQNLTVTPVEPEPAKEPQTQPPVPHSTEPNLSTGAYPSALGGAGNSSQIPGPDERSANSPTERSPDGTTLASVQAAATDATAPTSQPLTTDESMVTLMAGDIENLTKQINASNAASFLDQLANELKGLQTPSDDNGEKIKEFKTKFNELIRANRALNDAFQSRIRSQNKIKQVSEYTGTKFKFSIEDPQAPQPHQEGRIQIRSKQTDFRVLEDIEPSKVYVGKAWLTNKKKEKVEARIEKNHRGIVTNKTEDTHKLDEQSQWNLAFAMASSYLQSRVPQDKIVISQEGKLDEALAKKICAALGHLEPSCRGDIIVEGLSAKDVKKAAASLDSQKGPSGLVAKAVSGVKNYMSPPPENLGTLKIEHDKSGLSIDDQRRDESAKSSSPGGTP